MPYFFELIPTIEYYDNQCVLNCIHNEYPLTVHCPSLTDPYNGVMNCSLGDDGIYSYEYTCSFTCNTGYELTGSDTRTCQSNGSWSGTDDVCRRGTYLNRYM